MVMLHFGLLWDKETKELQEACKIVAQEWGGGNAPGQSKSLQCKEQTWITPSCRSQHLENISF